MAKFEIREKALGKWVKPCVAGAVAALRAVRAAQAGGAWLRIGLIIDE